MFFIKKLSNFSKLGNRQFGNLLSEKKNGHNFYLQSINFFSTDIEKTSNTFLENDLHIKPNGIVKLVLMLPARKEKCEFTLRYLNENIGSLIEKIKQEDKSIEKVVFYTNGNFFLKKKKLLLFLFKR